MTAVRVVVAILGVALVLWTLSSAVRTVVLPRASSSVLTRAVFITVNRVFDLIAPRSRPFEQRDRVHAAQAPTALLMLPAVWVALGIVGFTAVYWGMGVDPLSEAFITSGSSMLTLGFERPSGLARTTVAFVEAGIGLGLVTLMISYLPSIYAAFSRRESLVGMLEVRAGLPPSPTELIVRYMRIGRLDELHPDVFGPWEQWFVDVEESHTSFPALAFFRSPHPERSWITAAGCVLDAAAISASTLDRPRDGRAEVMMRTGWFCLRRICTFYGVPYDPDPAPTDPITVTRREFDLLCVELTAAGVPLKSDRERAWRDYAGWRVNYDAPLIGLCSLVDAPPGKWSSDRVPPQHYKPKILRARRRGPWPS